MVIKSPMSVEDLEYVAHSLRRPRYSPGIENTVGMLE